MGLTRCPAVLADHKHLRDYDLAACDPISPLSRFAQGRVVEVVSYQLRDLADGHPSIDRLIDA